jgi:acyl-CoA synthetase (AMP-forming)/AMP-acid ligase II
VRRVLIQGEVVAGPGDAQDVADAGALVHPRRPATACRLDQDGVLWFDDRFKDVIKSGGENVSSVEIEKRILEIESSVAEVAVVGLPHRHWTEAITAFVVARKDHVVDVQDLGARLRASLSAFKCPKAILVVDALPKTATGKVQKAQLRQSHAAHYD